MKLIAQMNNWILQNVVIMKINNCLTRVNHFSTHHQFLAMWYCYDNVNIEKNDLLIYLWTGLSFPQRNSSWLLLLELSITMTYQKTFWDVSFSFYCETILKVHSSFICFCCYFHLLHDFIVTDKLLFFQFIYFDDAIPAAFYIDMICTSFFCLIFYLLRSPFVLGDVFVNADNRDDKNKL